MGAYIFTFIWNMINFYVFGIYDEFCYKLFGNRRPLESEKEEDIKGEVVVITGANRGIGKQIALEMAKRKATVVFGCRNMKVGEEAVNDIRKETGNNNLDLVQLDLMDMYSVEQFASTVSNKYPSIKILVNNAGIPLMESDDPDELTKDGFNPLIAANHLGHFLLTNMLLKNLKKGSATGPSRVIAVSSSIQTLSTLDTNDLMMKKSGFGYMRELPYANSKHANSLMAREISKRMKIEGSNVYAYSICPGMVHTDIYSGTTGISNCLFSISDFIVGLSVEQAVIEYLIPICLSKDLGENESGLMYRHRKPCLQINRKLNRETELSENLWNLSAQLVKLDEKLPRPNEIIPTNNNDEHIIL